MVDTHRDQFSADDPSQKRRSREIPIGSGELGANGVRWDVILGYTPQQRRIIAAIARYLGKSRPAMEDGPMKMVEPASARTCRRQSCCSAWPAP